MADNDSLQTQNSSERTNGAASAAPAPHQAVQDRPSAPTSPRRSLGWRVLRWIGIALLVLVLLVAALLGAGWFWAGSQGSLSTVLTRAATYMPAGQTLQSRDVSGSVRQGGTIGWLRWQSPTLAVEVHDASIAWSLPPLLHHEVKLGELHAAQLIIEPIGTAPKKADSAIKPLDGITLPVNIEFPFRFDNIRWAGSPPLDVSGLAGNYAYRDGTHHLVVDGVDVADGHYSAKVTLQGAAPMALDAALQARLRAPVPGSDAPPLTVAGTVTAKGTLATQAARLQIEASVQSEPNATAMPPAGVASGATPGSGNTKAGPVHSDTKKEPLSARVNATVRPWLAQPIETAHAELHGLNLARLFPQLPETLLSGIVDAGPATARAANAASAQNTSPTESASAASTTSPQAAPSEATIANTAWQIQADIKNAEPGPYDKKRLPVEQLKASAELRDGVWRISHGDIALAGGSIALQGQWGPAPASTDPASVNAPGASDKGTSPGTSQPAKTVVKPKAPLAPWNVKATLIDIAPGGLYTALQGPAIGGDVTAQSRGDAVDFDLALKAAPGGSAKAAAAARKLGGKEAAANADTIDLRGLRLRSADATGRFTAHDSTLVLKQLKLLAADATVQGNATAHLAQKAGSAKLAVKIPGGTAQIDGEMAPTRGQGTANIAVANAAQLESWVRSLPGLAEVFSGVDLSGNARLDTSWNGGYETVMRQLDGKKLLKGEQAFTVSAKLDTPSFDVQLPAPAAKAVAAATSKAADAVTGSDVVRAIRNEQSNTAQPQHLKSHSAIKTKNKGTTARHRSHPSRKSAKRSGKSAPHTVSSGVNAHAQPATQISLRRVHLDLSGTLADLRMALKGEVHSAGRKANIDTSLQGGLDAPGRFHASVAALNLSASDPSLPGPWQLKLSSPLDVKFDQKAASKPGSVPELTVQTSGSGARLSGPVPGTVVIAWDPIRFSQIGTGSSARFQLQSKGTIKNLPMSWAEAFTKGSNSAMADAGLSGNLVFGASWDIDAADALNAKIEVARTSGDIRVRTGNETGTVMQVSSSGSGKGPQSVAAKSRAPTTAAGIRDLRVTVVAKGGAVDAELVWDSERAGQIDAKLGTRLARVGSGWTLPTDAPLTGSVKARLPDIGVWSMFAPPGWRVAGTLEADAQLSGTRSDPRYSGTLKADGLSVISVVDGIELKNGKLRATLQGDQVRIEEFSLHGGTGPQTRIAGIAGSLTSASELSADSNGGVINITGTLGWGPAPGANQSNASPDIRMALTAKADKLRVSVRTDRQVTISGTLDARLTNGQLRLRGGIVTDRAAIILPDSSAPTLGSDVHIHSAAIDRAAAEKAAKAAKKAAKQAKNAAKEGGSTQMGTAKPPDIVVTFDLGPDFAVQGKGLTTRLTGKLTISSTEGLQKPPRVTGEIRTASGQYRAYGQALNIESGVISFSGAVDNPSLDIVAIRPNIAVRAGVRVTGSVQSPQVRLFSDPDLPDAEKLSWVILGRSTANGGAEAALLQQAALAFLSGDKGGSGGIAKKFGLDEIGFKGPGSGGDASAAALTFGKRISNKLYVTYERSLSGTVGALYIFYDLTKRLTLRGQTGQQNGVDLIYTITFN
jgi:translocation and assembly module TamB